MREIRFRAWCIKGNGYIQGFNLFNYHSYYNKGLKKYIQRYSDRWIEDDYILEQFTGLTDKNGKDIYEGDIINADIFSYSRTVPTMGEIVYDSFFGFFANKNYGGSTGLFKLANIEVIGNIHNDKNLLDNIS